MAQFKSRYPSLGFYVNGELRRFSNGQFSTDDADTIDVLTKIADAQRVDEQPKAEAKPATKAKSAPATKAKTSAK